MAKLVEMRELADYIQRNVFDSALQRGLVADIRAGVYAYPRCKTPRTSIIIALKAMRAPRDVIAHVEKLDFVDDHRPSAVAIQQALALMDDMSPRPPSPLAEVSVVMNDETIESALTLLVHEGEFTDAVCVEHNKRIERALRNMGNDNQPAYTLTAIVTPSAPGEPVPELTAAAAAAVTD